MVREPSTGSFKNRTHICDTNFSLPFYTFFFLFFFHNYGIELNTVTVGREFGRPSGVTWDVVPEQSW